MNIKSTWSVTRESSKLNLSPVRTPLYDALKVFYWLTCKMAVSFVQVSIEMFKTLRVLASQPWYVFQSDYLGLT